MKPPCGTKGKTLIDFKQVCMHETKVWLRLGAATGQNLEQLMIYGNPGLLTGILLSKIALFFLDHALDNIGDAASPRLVCVAPQVDRLVRQYCAGCHIFNLNVDIDNQIAHLSTQPIKTRSACNERAMSSSQPLHSCSWDLD